MRKKKMTKKQLEKYIEKKFGKVDNSGHLRGIYIQPLCVSMPPNSGWSDHWHKLNTHGKSLMPLYFKHCYTLPEVSFLRLLSLHLFVRGL